MRIVIVVEERDPPAGHVVLEELAARGGGTQEVPFVGWLGLLAALAEIVEPQDGPNPGTVRR
ncbi:MAG TPA: hypothetical protein VFJ12_10840 [Segeticoccus sp.]|jgi:hypothetical protein|nr:hypothetical protein [Segeticoccus sp.]